MLSLICALGTHANAECGDPTWNGLDDSSVPLRGSLYVYDVGVDPYVYGPRDEPTLRIEDGLRLADSPHDTHLLDDIEQARVLENRAAGPLLRQPPGWLGPPGQTRETLIAPGVVRVDYEGPAGSVLLLNEARYTLTTDFRAPVVPPRVEKYWREQSAWTCSMHDALHIHIDQRIAAVRATWRSGNTTRTWTFPPFGRPGWSTLMLGKIDCAGMSFDPRELDAGGSLSLVAIHVGGTEVAIEGLPTWLSSSTIETFGSLENDGARSHDDGDRHEAWFALCLAGLGSAAFLLARRRARAAASPPPP